MFENKKKYLCSNWLVNYIDFLKLWLVPQVFLLFELLKQGTIKHLFTFDKNPRASFDMYELKKCNFTGFSC